MYSYVVCSTIIRSDIELPELTPSDEGTPEVTIELEDTDDRPASALPQGPSAANGYGRVVVSEPDRLVVEPNANVPPEGIRHLILGLGFRLLFHHRGDLVFHASAVAVEGRAVVFLGESGAGKSTLATAFDAAGYPVVADDVVVVSNPESPIVRTCFSGTKLDDRTAEAFDRTIADTDDQTLRRQYRTPRKTATSDEYPLERIYLLEPASSTSIRPVSMAESGFELMTYSYNEYGGETDNIEQDEVSAHFDRCTALARSIGGVSRLERTQELDALPDVVDTVVADLNR